LGLKSVDTLPENLDKNNKIRNNKLAERKGADDDG